MNLQRANANEAAVDVWTVAGATVTCSELPSGAVTSSILVRTAP
jgi:hypothetical protein